MRPSTIATFALVVVLGAAAAYRPARSAPVQQAGPIAESNIPITQIAHASIGGVVGAIDGSGTPPLSLTMPANGGLLIKRISVLGGQPQVGTILVTVEGVEVFRAYTSSDPLEFSPGILVRPGQTVLIGTPAANSVIGPLVISGYGLTLADLGL